MKNRHKLSYKQMMYKLALWRYIHAIDNYVETNRWESK